MRKELPALFHMHYKYDGEVLADLREAEIFRVDVEADTIEDSDLYSIWPQVEAADLAEIRQFVEEKAFRKVYLDSLTSETIVVDSRWVRKWKRMPDRTTKVKSRLCARGFISHWDRGIHRPWYHDQSQMFA